MLSQRPAEISEQEGPPVAEVPPAAASQDSGTPFAPPRPSRSGARLRLAPFIRLARPHQWAKSGFVFLGPLYGLQDLPGAAAAGWALLAACVAAVSFSLVSSACYVFNDLGDIEQDRHHPRKRLRPLASGEVSPAQARVFALALLAIGLAAPAGLVPLAGWGPAAAVLLLALAHAANVTLYSVYLKRIVVADVISLSLGFVLRVLAGCAAAAVSPSTWLLNVTFFLSLFLAFGKRMGERRTAGSGEEAARLRGVLGRYSDELLRMFVVVSGVATLVTYAGYVQDRGPEFLIPLGFSGSDGVNVLWPSILPATYGLLRAILLVEEGLYDDPTELVLRDRPFQVAIAAFAACTVGALLLVSLFDAAAG